MAKYYGDIPCVKLGKEIHITVSGIKCLCGCSWQYAKPDGHSMKQNVDNNIIWRDIEAVTCPSCRKKYLVKENKTQ